MVSVAIHRGTGAASSMMASIDTTTRYTTAIILHGNGNVNGNDVTSGSMAMTLTGTPSLSLSSSTTATTGSGAVSVGSSMGSSQAAASSSVGVIRSRQLLERSIADIQKRVYDAKNGHITKALHYNNNNNNNNSNGNGNNDHNITNNNNNNTNVTGNGGAGVIDIMLSAPSIPQLSSSSLSMTIPARIRVQKVDHHPTHY
jgi:hypothetical protein